MYSCIYIATKQSNKVAITSIAAAVINLAVDLLCINKIGLYAASVSSLIAFFAMFIIRYFDVNKIVRMKINHQVVVSSILIGSLLSLAYYSKDVPNSCFYYYNSICSICEYGFDKNCSKKVEVL